MKIKRKKKKEDEITHGLFVKAALDYLDSMQQNGAPIYAFKVGTGKVRLDSGRYFHSGEKGCPDIILSMNGFIGIEIKVGDDDQSDEQKQAQTEIEASGGLYIICHDSLENLRKLFRDKKKE